MYTCISCLEPSKNTFSIYISYDPFGQEHFQTFRSASASLRFAMGANACSKICGFMGRSEVRQNWLKKGSAPRNKGVGHQAISSDLMFNTFLCIYIV